ncbi:beta 1-4 rhamnosyltransferase Cps2T [Enterococcus sp. AZ126]|uniref:beta 1-4 rhamnosyltransferase Cps2T n=1 Tax=Enterococcus sp. AZ126 TaxID=2774635 RepID=UPI003F24339C
MSESNRHIYIIGSKGIPAKYGGFETFVEKLTQYKKSDRIHYHVACMNTGDNLYGNGQKHFIHNQADCFNIAVPNIGPAKAIYYDMKALDYSIALAKTNNDSAPIFYILACRIGPFINHYRKKIQKIGGKLYVNPDGHEWLRAKWSYPVRKYWKYSEKLMVKHADLLICDSLSIEEYIKNDYKRYSPKTIYISYGTDIEESQLSINDLVVREWFSKNELLEKDYFLVVGRFVPENNYQIMIQEFMKTSTKKNLVLITNIEKNKFYTKLKKKTYFNEDSRIKFVGTMYDQELLKYIRENAFAYIHGHEVGGTNPSLLEALASTKLNLLFDVDFNREVAGDGAMYWNKSSDNLKYLLNNISKNDVTISVNDEKLSSRIENEYSWEKIIDMYEEVFGDR